MREKLVDAWPACSFEVRIMDSFMMLKLHGAITDAEAVKVKNRIDTILRKRKEADELPGPDDVEYPRDVPFVFGSGPGGLSGTE